MAINRELSQFGRLVQIIDNVSIGIGTTSNIRIGFGTVSAAGYFVNNTQVINSSGVWVGSSSGLQGSTGTQGATGTQGTTGTTGSTGSQGTTGTQGTTGGSATLTMNTSGTGLSGSATYNGSSIATFTVTSNATSANTVSTIVARDASGNFTAGTITATDFNSTSDINLKTNIQTIENPINKLLEINGVTFKWIENEKASVGVIAQDVEKVFPELITNMGAHKVVNYNGLIGLLVECIKHQQKQIDELKEHMIGS